MVLRLSGCGSHRRGPTVVGVWQLSRCYGRRRVNLINLIGYRKILQNEHIILKIGFGTAENSPCKTGRPTNRGPRPGKAKHPVVRDGALSNHFTQISYMSRYQNIIDFLRLEEESILNYRIN